MLCALGSAQAAEPIPGWLALRDANPFVLASGLPLAPALPSSGAWQLDTTLAIANTELQQTRDDASLRFDAETHEARFSAAHAFNDDWSMRVSISHLWIGAGFLDGPVERFHRAFGLDNGDRGLLHTQAPLIEVGDGSGTLYRLDRTQSGVGPVLLDLTRSWRIRDAASAGLSLGTKLPTGSSSRLSDSESTDVSLSGYTVLEIGERLTLGLRGGILVQEHNRLLGDYARDVVPFASVLVRYRLGRKWSAVLQSDAHGPLYRDLPEFLGSASNQLNFGLIRRWGDSGEWQLTLGEDLPALRTSDIAINLNLRVNVGR